jgi:hypothetical protein
VIGLPGVVAGRHPKAKLYSFAGICTEAGLVTSCMLGAVFIKRNLALSLLINSEFDISLVNFY